MYAHSVELIGRCESCACNKPMRGGGDILKGEMLIYVYFSCHLD